MPRHILEQAPSTLDRHFNSNEREPLLYALWEEAGIFRPEAAPNQTAAVFNISMPPPNANGELHLGHAFGYTVMDILGRFHRLRGERVLLLPGKDHAGIQTQVVFEKKLKSEGVDIANKSTEELFQECYAFCIDRAQYMRAQEKRLGLSADWSRELFTLDPRLNEIIFETFEQLWRDGLVYKGNRIVNWSVFSQTAISDVEVEYKEQEGKLWYVSYPLAAGSLNRSSHEVTLPSGEKALIGQPGIYVATTRPETILGDTAVAVHPADPRYVELIGKAVLVPLTGRSVPIIGDERVDPEYGTGVVKVTPAHDFSDYDMGVDHNLPFIQVIGKDGRMTPEAGAAFSGLTLSAAREAVVKRLEEERLLLDCAPIKHKVPIGERGKDIIEPLISEQWFVNVDAPGKSLKQNALDLLHSGRIEIFPHRFGVLFEQWLNNLRDWNISRQLWWGHRLPVWYKREGGREEIYVGSTPPKGSKWEQEKDVFDTWFSSGQWAYSTIAASGLVNLDRPTNDEPYFPTHTMVMGRDILFFWACRMLLLTAYRTGDVPWRRIFFTGLIRDEFGQKMSKSKGNGIDPNETIDKYGADSLRLALVMGASPGNDLSLSERKIEGYSKFINKIWNAGKLLELKVASVGIPTGSFEAPTLLSSKWILGELSRVFEVVTQKLSEYEVSIAADEVYKLTWTVFCDWYLEMMKVLVDSGSPAQRKEACQVCSLTFETILTMLHPFIPFVTEELYQKLPFVKRDRLLASSSWQLHAPKISEPCEEIELVREVISGIRSVKAALNIPHKRIRVALADAFCDESLLLVREVARVDLSSEAEIPQALALRKPVRGSYFTCEVEGKESYRKKLEKEAQSHQQTIATLEKKLSGEFATHAKPDVVEKERERLSHAKHALAELERDLSLV